MESVQKILFPKIVFFNISGHAGSMINADQCRIKFLALVQRHLKDGSQYWGLFAHFSVQLLGLTGLTMRKYGSFLTLRECWKQPIKAMWGYLSIFAQSWADPPQYRDPFLCHITLKHTYRSLHLSYQKKNWWARHRRFFFCMSGITLNAAFTMFTDYIFRDDHPPGNIDRALAIRHLGYHQITS